MFTCIMERCCLQYVETLKRQDFYKPGIRNRVSGTASAAARVSAVVVDVTVIVVDGVVDFDAHDRRVRDVRDAAGNGNGASRHWTPVRRRRRLGMRRRGAAVGAKTCLRRR